MLDSVAAGAANVDQCLEGNDMSNKPWLLVLLGLGVAGVSTANDPVWLTLHLDSGLNGQPSAGLRYDLGNQSSAILLFHSKLTKNENQMSLESSYRINTGPARPGGRNLLDVSLILGIDQPHAQLGLAGYLGREWRFSGGLTLEGRAGLRTMFSNERLTTYLPEARIGLGFAI